MIDWHRLFGLALTDFFTGSPFVVELEKDLSLKQQFLDVVILRKGPGEVAGPLPDGLENLAGHNLLSYKSLREPLDDWALDELIGHYVNYRKQMSPSSHELFPREQLRLYGVSTRFPQKLSEQVRLEEVQTGVYEVGWGTHRIRVLVLSQMPEEELEMVMADFATGRSDVLVCSTIIESGLDMPNANTLIVNQSDKFGLTQLYQLRGRVGRGANLAYAYFLYEKGKRLTPTAEKRLRTIFEATELGAGFGIAMKDLEIRGAGTLLGIKQSGYINAVGFSLYCQLLGEAVERQKVKQAGIPREKVKLSHLPPPTIDLPLPAYIPEEYVADLNTRLSLYRRLAEIKSVEQVEGLAQEFSDRFGTPPPEVRNLLYALRIKILAAKAGIESISTEDGQITLRLFEGMKFDKQKLEPFLKDGIKVGTTRLRLSPKRLGGEWQEVLEDILNKIRCYNNGSK